MVGLEGRVDLDAVADELYGMPPGDFTAARDERAKAARASGNRELAEQIRRLRRPTLAAWASNLLVREQPDETKRLLQLGEALRQAHRDLDGKQLRELSAQQRQVIWALARQASHLTAQAGQRISEDAQHEVEETLHAVLADPQAGQEWLRGRLTKPLNAPMGFAAVTDTAGVPPAPRRGEKATDSKVADLDAARARRREQQERLNRARQQAEDAERDLHARQEDQAAAQDEVNRAEDRQNQAQEHLAELKKQVEGAETEQRSAGDAVRKARERLREAERAVREARRRAQDAAAHAARLANQTSRRH